MPHRPLLPAQELQWAALPVTVKGWLLILCPLRPTVQAGCVHLSRMGYINVFESRWYPSRPSQFHLPHHALPCRAFLRECWNELRPQFAWCKQQVKSEICHFTLRYPEDCSEIVVNFVRGFQRMKLCWILAVQAWRLTAGRYSDTMSPGKLHGFHKTGRVIAEPVFDKAIFFREGFWKKYLFFHCLPLFP